MGFRKGEGRLVPFRVIPRNGEMIGRSWRLVFIPDFQPSQFASGVLEDGLQLRGDFESVLVEVKTVPNGSVGVALRGGFPVTKHFNEIEERHALYSFGVVLWMVGIVLVVMA